MVKKQVKHRFLEFFLYIMQHNLYLGLHTWSSEFPIFSSRRESRCSKMLQNTHWRRRWHPHWTKISSHRVKF